MNKMQHFIIILIILILSFCFFAIMYFHANEKIQKSIEYNLSNNSNYVVNNETIKLHNENTSLARAISLYTKSIFQLNVELKNIKKKGENLEKHKIINDNIALSYYNRGGCYF